MAPEDMKKTPLVTKTGLYDWTVMPFGLKNVTSTFTRTMSLVFKELGDKFLKVFVDDLNVHSENWADHLQHLEAILSKFREVNLKLNPGKCCFAAESIVFLGYVVSKEGAKPDPKKIDAILRFPEPTTVSNVRSFLGLIGYYRKYVRRYARLAGPLFELTKKEVAFIWNQGCQHAFDSLKRALVDAPILIRPDFKRPFCLDVDWSTKGVGVVLSQKEGRFEKVVAYVSKGLMVAQRKFHPMEGECYALIWGIMHFRQYLQRNHFILQTNHKPLEWLVTVSDANGRRGRWVDMLQDFSFKIIHRPRLKHTNVDALSRNPVGLAADDDDFGEEIQDIASTRTDASKGDEEFLCVRIGKEKEWFGIRRGDKELIQHRACCFGINHYRYDGSHQLYIVDIVSGEEQPEEVVSGQAEAVVGGEPVQDDGERIVVKRRRPQYFDKPQQLDLILEAQELAEFGDQELSSTESDKEEDQEMDAKCIDIWGDAVCLGLLKNGALPDSVDLEESKRARKRVSNYCWKEQRLYFKGLLVPKPEERMSLVSQMHEDLGHFGEQRTLAEIRRRYF